MAETGRAIRIEPSLRLVRAPNPSPMTFTGTNTWIVGDGEVAVIDPGPTDPHHLSAIMAALAPNEKVVAILVTHAHRDHSPLARPLADRTGARIFAAGDYAGRRRGIMARLAADGLVGGGEGIDDTFWPDVVLEDGRRVIGEGWQIATLATPGHTADHLAFVWGDAVFTGDHVMGWASSLVSPPDGDIVSFYASCAHLAEHPSRIYYPGHGDPVLDPHERLAWLVEHRESRTRAILTALQSGPATPEVITRAVYTEVTPALLPAAERNVLAHLIALVEEGIIQSVEPLSATSVFRLC